MGLVITDSANISFFDFHSDFDVPNLDLILDLSPTTWIGTGYSNVKGVKFTVTSPSGVALVSSSPGTYDIVPPNMVAGTVTYTLIQAFQSVEWGIYQITATITDANDTTYVLSKAFDLCRPKQTGNQVNTSSASMILSITSVCRDGTATAFDNTVYSYKGVLKTSIDFEGSIYLDSTLELPNPFITVTNNSPVQYDLYTGKNTYKAAATVTYEFDDEFQVELGYIGEFSKEVACSLDFCKFYCCVADLITLAQRQAGTPDALATMEKVELLWVYRSMIDQAVDCGFDDSRWTALIQQVGNCDCTCDCVGRVQPAPVGSDVINIIGTGSVTVTQATAGNTTTFTVNGKTFSVSYGGTQATPEITIVPSTTGNVTNFAVSLNLASLVTYFQANLSVGGTLFFDGTVTVIPTNTTETTIYTYTLPAATGTNVPVNTLSKDGDSLKWRTQLQNQLSSTTNDRIIRFKFGGTTIQTITIASSALELITVDIEIIRVGTNSQIINFVWYRGVPLLAIAVYTFFNTNAANLSATNAMVVTGQNTTAAASTVQFFETHIQLVKKV